VFVLKRQVNDDFMLNTGTHHKNTNNQRKKNFAQQDFSSIFWWLKQHKIWLINHS